MSVPTYFCQIRDEKEPYSFISNTRKSFEKSGDYSWGRTGRITANGEKALDEIRAKENPENPM